MQTSGRIIEEQKNYFIIDTAPGALRATTKGALKKNRTRLCVGDFVDYEVTNEDRLEGVITKLHNRKSFLMRPPLANLDLVVLITTFKEPPLDLDGVDRFLFAASVHGFMPLIVFNKIDRLTETELAELNALCETYRSMEYTVLSSSAMTGVGVDDIISHCTDRVAAFAGLSGVGKSTLLSKILPGVEFRIGDVSGATGRGTHTTTFVRLLPLPRGGHIADTPGFSFVSVPSIDESEVINHFPELARQIGRCKFNNCIHDNDKGCAVAELVLSGEIASWRVEHYLKIFREMRDKRREYR